MFVSKVVRNFVTKLLIMSKYNKEELERLIFDEGLSYAEIGRRYSVTGAAIKKAAKRLGIELPQKRTINPSESFNKGKTLLDKLNDEQFIDIINTSTGWEEIINKIGYKTSGSDLRTNILKRCDQLQVSPNILTYDPFLTRTKGELFLNRKNWQSARSSIQHHARKVYFDSNPTPKCAICGYTNHVEVAHIKAVADFSDDATISDINSISNLVGLCPNHHWEYDNGMLKI